MKLRRLRNRSAIAVSAMVVIAAACAAGCKSSALEPYKRALIKSGRADYTLPESGLALSIHPRDGQEVFYRREPILIDVRLTNVTNSVEFPLDVNVYTEIAQDGLLLHLELNKLDGNGGQVYLTQPLEVGVEERMMRFTHYVTLQPGFFIGRPLQFGRNLRPGIYELTVTYANNHDACPLSPRLTPSQIRLLDEGVGFVGLWKGVLVSNTIVFQVIEKELKK